MKTNKFLGLVGSAAALFAVFSMACAAPAVSRSGSDDDDSDDSEKTTKSDTSSSSTPTSPVTSSTATTTGTTTTTTPDAGVATVPSVNWCGKLNSCIEESDDFTQLLIYSAAVALGNQTGCQASYLGCKSGIFQSNCEKLTDCCDEMVTNGNANLANACRTKANAGVSATCSTQLSTYKSVGQCN